MARRKSKNKKKNKSLDFKFIILIIISIILSIVIYFKTGYIGEKIAPVVGGIFGPVKLIIPPALILLAISMIKEEKKEYNYKIAQWILIIVLVSSIFSIYQISKEIIDISEPFEKNIQKSYELRSNKYNWWSDGLNDSNPCCKNVTEQLELQ